MAERQRLDKILGHMGYGTRKEVKSIVKGKRVAVNGTTATDPGSLVVPDQDRITVDDQEVLYKQFLYLMLHKPAGYLSATEDGAGAVVTDLLTPTHRAFAPFPVGRLDKDTEGLLLLTNDGPLAHHLLSPRRHVPKTYYAVVHGEVTAADGETFHRGVTLDGGYRTMPGELRILRAGPESEIELTIYEGKYHQVKRMFAAVGKQVAYLKRLAMGPLRLDAALKPGEYRELTPAEVESLLAAPAAPTSSPADRPAVEEDRV